MFEIATEADRIDVMADAALTEIRRMRDEAMREIDRMLGFTATFTARSLGQRRRYERQRLSKELV